MAFERLDSIVARVVSRVVNDGDQGGLTGPSDASTVQRTADAEAPAKFREETTQPAEAASRAERTGRPTHTQAPPQRRVGRPLLFVVEGGGSTGGGGRSNRRIAQQENRGEPARNLRLVVSHHASAF